MRCNQETGRTYGYRPVKDCVFWRDSEKTLGACKSSIVTTRLRQAGGISIRPYTDLFSNIKPIKKLSPIGASTAISGEKPNSKLLGPSKS